MGRKNQSQLHLMKFGTKMARNIIIIYLRMIAASAFVGFFLAPSMALGAAFLFGLILFAAEILLLIWFSGVLLDVRVAWADYSDQTTEQAPGKARGATLATMLAGAKFLLMGGAFFFGVVYLELSVLGLFFGALVSLTAICIAGLLAFRREKQVRT